MTFEEEIAKTLLEKITQVAIERQLNDEEINNLIDVSVKKVFTDGIKAMSDGMVSQLAQQIPEMIEQERERRTAFEQSLYARWNEALDLFDAAIILTREAGDRFLKKYRTKTKKEEKPLFEALVEVHMHACQTAAAISVLLKSGFARDALARQRTLHELAVVASLLKEHGPSLAERFLAHETIETCAAAEQYEQSYLRLGLEPPDPDNLAKLQAVDIRHHPVGDEQRIVILLPGSPRLAAIDHRCYRISQLPEDGAENEAGGGIVFGDQYFHTGSFSCEESELRIISLISIFVRSNSASISSISGMASVIPKALLMASSCRAISIICVAPILPLEPLSA